jgi:hypothetical protein
LSPDVDQWIDRQVQSVLEIQGYAANTQSMIYAYQTSEKVIRLPF